MSVYSDRAPTVMRWAVTTIGKDGLRTLFCDAQGRNTQATRDEAQALLDRFDRDQIRGKLGDRVADTLEVREVECWAGHHDPCGIYFEE